MQRSDGPTDRAGATGGATDPADHLPRAEIEALQLDRLRAVVARAYANVALFRRRMDARGIGPGDVCSLADLARLPFSWKSDLREAYPYGLFASPMSEVVRLHASSGTTGKPIVVGYTQEDLDVWRGVMRRTFAACGLHRGDILQNAYGYGLFTGGLGAHYGAEALGAAVIPISGGNTERQIMVLRDFGVTAICCTPSYFLHLIERAEGMSVRFDELKLRIGIFGAEPWTDEMRRHIEMRTGIRAYDIYGLTEIIGPGVGSECCAQAGLHIFEDHFLAEIVDPESGDPVPDGREGELVLTTLSKRAMPMIRYRTRDVTAVIPAPCTCGRTLRRVRRIARRCDDMLIVRGVNVYPSQVESAILKVERSLPHYQIVLRRERGLDEIEVQIEITPEAVSDRVGALEELERRLAHAIESTVGIRARVRLVEPQSIARSEGKARRVVDLRA